MTARGGALVIARDVIADGTGEVDYDRGSSRCAAPPRALHRYLSAPTERRLRTLERLVHAVSARGGTTRVYTTTDPGVRRGRGRRSVWRRPSIAFWAYPQLRIAAPILGRVYRDLSRWQPTLIDAATPFGMGLAGRSCARALGVPLVTSYHTSFNEYARYYHLGALSKPGWAFIRWFHNSGERTYVPTRAVLDELRALRFERSHSGERSGVAPIQLWVSDAGVADSPRCGRRYHCRRVRRTSCGREGPGYCGRGHALRVRRAVWLRGARRPARRVRTGG